MTALHDTAARRERQGARALGAARVRRARGESAPDVPPVTTSSGVALQAEVKSRARLPYIVTGALRQAERYARGEARPVAIVFHKGQRGGLAIVRLADFADLVGLDVAALPPATPLRRPEPAHGAQLMLPGVH